MIVCPPRGEENPERSRFCLSCGHPLAARPAVAGEERKVVSVLFVDLVGLRAARIAPTRRTCAPRSVRITNASSRTDIERFGGTVEKFIGDAVMAVFGAPVAHEDDAERAVRSALGLGRCGDAKAQREGQAMFERLGASPVLAQAA